MSLVDGLVFTGFLVWVVYDGLRQARKSRGSDPFLAGRTAPWWVLGLSIMATQASAITLVGTTGKGWADGTRFVQFYYALPLAMLILSVTLAPRLSRLGVTTVYEYLGQRFDGRTRVLTALVFVLLRTTSLGVVIAAAAVVVGTILGVSPITAALCTGAVAILYTSVGGFAAVLATDVKQMAAMTLGVGAALIGAANALPEAMTVGEAWTLAESTGRTVLADWSWDPSERYSIPSALIGGTFLFLAYFGCDQSQAQRLLAGRSLADVRGALFGNALAKVPFQLCVLGTGTLLFVVYTFHEPPASFVPDHATAIENQTVSTRAYDDAWRKSRDDADAYVTALRSENDDQIRVARAAFVRSHDALAKEREAVGDALELETGVGASETNFVILHFARWGLPIGIAGLLFAAILAAALSSIDSELNALAAVFVIDLSRSERVVAMKKSRIATVALGVLATGISIFALQAGALIEVVNWVGSYFYGPLLGVFILAFIRWTSALGATVGLVGGFAGLIGTDLAYRASQADGDALPFLYLNVIGTVVTVGVGLATTALTGHSNLGRPDP